MQTLDREVESVSKRRGLVHRRSAAGQIAQYVPMPSVLAHRQLARMSARLLAEARRNCAREGIAPADPELFARMASRLGLSVEAVAQTLAPANIGLELYCDNIARLDHVRARRRFTALAATILGFRERVVFLARCLSNADATVPVARLGQRLGITPHRVAAIEASARRKIAIASWVEGLPDMIGIKGLPPMTQRGTLSDLPGERAAGD
jgi:hypothetical protein